MVYEWYHGGHVNANEIFKWNNSEVPDSLMNRNYVEDLIKYVRIT